MNSKHTLRFEFQCRRKICLRFSEIHCCTASGQKCFRLLRKSGSNILLQLFCNKFHRDEELQKQKVEDVRKCLLQRGVSIGNNTREVNLFDNMIFVHKLDLPIPPYQEECKKKILNAKNKKLTIDGVQISHPNDTKEKWISGREYVPSILLNNTEEYAELISAKKASKEERILLFIAKLCQLSLTQSFPY